jgi:hypothetical protein
MEQRRMSVGGGGSHHPLRTLPIDSRRRCAPPRQLCGRHRLVIALPARPCAVPPKLISHVVEDLAQPVAPLAWAPAGCAAVTPVIVLARVLDEEALPRGEQQLAQSIVLGELAQYPCVTCEQRQHTMLRQDKIRRWHSLSALQNR